MTRKEIIQQSHSANSLLNAPFIAQLPIDNKDLSTDQPTTALEPDVIASTIEALESGQTHYVDVPGIMPLREAVVSFLTKLGITGYDASQIVITASVQEARFLTLQTMLTSSVAIPEVVHPGVKKALGVRVPDVHMLEVDTNTGMLPTLNSLREVLEKGVKTVYLESPVRLTGAVFEASVATEISQLVASHGATLICDQGLAPWVLADGVFAYAPMPASTTTFIGDIFPGVGLEAMPLGFIATDSEYVVGITKLKQIMSICTSTASQYAALKISETYDAKRGELIKELKATRDALEQQLGGHILPGHVASLIALGADAKASLEGYSYADGADFGAANTLRLLVSNSLVSSN
ncbi:MAG: aminotransferase class I/II-fold pyridoxal phosphate-dependent enzyme [Deinococcota bacterium]